ncbi:hypothetical protein CSPAE12_08885 [Colletotrichum incanum]|nr:hypothetical protein CSPAE12_08885 [Colletotrichum incanum]
MYLHRHASRTGVPLGGSFLMFLFFLVEILAVRQRLTRLVGLTRRDDIIPSSLSDGASSCVWGVKARYGNTEKAMAAGSGIGVSGVYTHAMVDGKEATAPGAP